VRRLRRTIYNRYKVTITGSVPVQSASGESKVQFRIEDEIDIVAVRSHSQRVGRQKQKLALSPVVARVPYAVGV
jgi:hypothetical protein